MERRREEGGLPPRRCVHHLEGGKERQVIFNAWYCNHLIDDYDVNLTILCIVCSRTVLLLRSTS